MSKLDDLINVGGPAMRKGGPVKKSKSLPRKKLKCDISEDIDSVYDEISYCAAMADGLERFCLAEKGRVPIDLFIHINNVKDTMQKAFSDAQRMLWKYNQLYGRD